MLRFPDSLLMLQKLPINISVTETCKFKQALTANMLIKFQAKYSSDIKTLKIPRCIRHRKAEEHNKVGVVSSIELSMYQEINNLT